MKKWIAFVVTAAAISIAAIALAVEEPAAGRPQTTCPVMGGEISKSKYVDYNGKRVYLCCGACVKTFNADPEKYIKKLQDEGVKLEDTPAK